MPNNSAFGHGWLWARLKGDGKALTKMAARITRAPDEIFVKYYYQHVTRIVFQARKIILNRIDTAVTRTGAERAAKGGKGPGRVKTEEMRKHVWAKVNKMANGRYRADVGWLDGRPGYAIFQEHGTRNGVVAMNALKEAGDYIEAEMNKLGRGGYKYRRDTNWDWEGTGTGEVPDWFVKE